MELIEKIKKEQNESFNKWFERWFAKKNLENEIVKSAREGFNGMEIRLDLGDPDEKTKYLNRRLQDPRTIEKLKEKLPGINIEFEKKRWRNLFGFYSTSEKILFSWRE